MKAYNQRITKPSSQLFVPIIRRINCTTMIRNERFYSNRISHKTLQVLYMQLLYLLNFLYSHLFHPCLFLSTNQMGTYFLCLFVLGGESSSLSSRLAHLAQSSLSHFALAGCIAAPVDASEDSDCSILLFTCATKVPTDKRSAGLSKSS